MRESTTFYPSQKRRSTWKTRDSTRSHAESPPNSNRRINLKKEHQKIVRKNERIPSLTQLVKATSHTSDFNSTKGTANIEDIGKAIENEK